MKLKKEIKIIPILKALICTLGCMSIMYSGYKVAEAYFNYIDSWAYEIAEVNVPKQKEKKIIYTADMSVQDKIKFYADMYGVNREDALRIAKCESGFNKDAENINGSATGVFQFIRKSWKYYNCGGDVKNADQNIICFMQTYPNHPGDWECK